jgi:hypothetical protein
MVGLTLADDDCREQAISLKNPRLQWSMSEIEIYGQLRRLLAA